jgi:DNA-binding MarR family transcriptional regulator
MRFVPPSSLPPLPCGCATLRRTSRALTQAYAKHLGDSALEITQFTLLQTLRMAGELTQRALGEILVLDSTTLSRSLQHLDRHGWIAIRPGKDRREKRIAITPSGTKRLISALQGWNDAQSELRRLFGETGWEETMRALDRLTVAALTLTQADQAGAAQ